MSVPLRVFEYMILYRKALSKRERDDGAPETLEIVQDVKRVVARDEKAVGMRAAREIPGEFADRLDEVEVLVRPFA